MKFRSSKTCKKLFSSNCNKCKRHFWTNFRNSSQEALLKMFKHINHQTLEKHKILEIWKLWNNLSVSSTQMFQQLIMIWLEKTFLNHRQVLPISLVGICHPCSQTSINRSSNHLPKSVKITKEINRWLNFTAVLKVYSSKCPNCKHKFKTKTRWVNNITSNPDLQRLTNICKYQTQTVNRHCKLSKILQAERWLIYLNSK